MDSPLGKWFGYRAAVWYSWLPWKQLISLCENQQPWLPPRGGSVENGSRSPRAEPQSPGHAEALQTPSPPALRHPPAHAPGPSFSNKYELTEQAYALFFVTWGSDYNYD